MTIKGIGYLRAETSYDVLKEKTKKRKRNRRRPNTMAGKLKREGINSFVGRGFCNL